MATAKLKILIVDDVAENRDILSRRFERRGFETIQAENGLEALERIAAERIDIVLLDVVMPVLDGIETLRRIRATHSASSLPVIMVTARSENKDIVEALELGANDYVTKPVDFPIAYARTQTQIARKLAEEALREVNADLERSVQDLVEANQRLEAEISERKRSEERVRHMAQHDALTGLGNRVLFRERVNRALAQTELNGDGIALLCLDLDDFKPINDTLGHAVGDSLLRVVAERLRAGVADGDLVVRLGGDEFAVIQTGVTSRQEPEHLARRIVEIVSTPCEIHGQQLIVSCSIGIAYAPEDGADLDTLLRSADMALYSAKAEGSGSCRFFEPAMRARANARRLLEVDLRQAIDRGELELYYQPLFKLATGTISGFEALLRWNHPKRGMIMPAEFIPLAEEVGLIVPLGEWVVRQACAEAAGWPGEVKVAVNISAAQFRSNELVPTIERALETSGLAPHRLEVEITETVLLSENERTLAGLHQLRRLGARISMDDFGTGYSSLRYLCSFPFDKIKVDQTFIRELGFKKGNIAVVRCVAELAQALGMDTTAEGVEREEQLELLRSAGYTEAQGNLISYPLPARYALPLLKSFGTGAEDSSRRPDCGTRDIA